MNFDHNKIDFNDMFRQVIKDSYKVSTNYQQQNIAKFKQEMHAIAEERRISHGLAQARERIRKEKMNEPFELGGAL